MAVEEYLFSFVMAVYNVEAYLGEAIESIVGQTIGMDVIQLILVDDGSVDASLAICKKWQARYPNNIVVIHQENAGVSAARNNGLGYVRGRYVSFMDSDDKIVPPTCERVSAFFEKHGAEVDLVAIPMVFFEAAKGDHILNVKFAKGNRVINLEKEWGFPQLSMSSAFVKSSALQNIGFDTRLKHLEDMKVVQLILLRKRAYGVVSTVRYKYRRRAGAVKSAVQSATQRKTWYIDTLTYASEALLDEVERQCGGVIPKYIQYAVMYDLQWRIAMEDITPGVLTKEEEDAYRNKMTALLRRIDADMILSQRNIYSEHKIHALIMRSREALTVKESGQNGFMFCLGDVVAIRASRIPVCLEFMWQQGERLVVDVSLKLPNAVADSLACHAFLWNRRIEPKLLSEKIVSWSMGEAILKIRYYRFEVPLTDIGSSGRKLSFFLRWHEHMVGLSITYGRFFPLTEKYLSSFWSCSKCIVSCSTKKWLYLEPLNRRLKVRRECRFLKDLWLKNQVGARKAVFARLAVHALRTIGIRPFWIITDRATAARDNGEAFFRFMCEQHPEQKVYFAVNKDAEAYARMKKVGPVLARSGFAYKLRLLLADWIVSSQAEEQVTNPFWGYDAPYKDILANKKYAFLGHGITQNDISGWIGRYKKGMSGIVAASRQEAQAFCGQGYGYASENVWLTGLPRYDRLYHDERKQILIMPTWRRELMGSLGAKTGVWSIKSGFKDSDYYKFYNGLINSPRLLSAAKKYGYTLVFLPHPNLQPYAAEFDCADGVTFLNQSCEYRDLFARGDVLVTDYSSVAFDFAYLRKPVVYSQFDKKSFYQRTSVLKPGYFDYERDGFGPVAVTLDRVIDELEHLMASGCRLEKRYQERIDAFFAFNDADNCQRVYERIQNYGR